MGANSEPHTSADAYTARTPAVSYRPMDWNDLDTVAACFDRVWPQGPALAGTPTALLVARYLTLHYLEQSTWSNVAVTAEGDLAGITLARVVGRPTLFPQAHEEFLRTRALLLADPRGAATVTMFEDGFFVREGILEEDSDITATTQAELELFMVNPGVRGAGVGGALWRQLLAALRSVDVRAFFLHTDSSCDYGFYDHKGLIRVAERIAADHPEDANLAPGMNTDDQFIYRADLAGTALGGAFDGAQGEVCGA
ncbi:GNAT family N-acetyltransferase [Bifidobacterium pseudolongum]|uniref:GNAT family N-acetyltransferase n=1 Tax=Bifidobacterium pseudolongum TaxID=1694 RepID=UPI00102281C6|nr:GNAT family N-acetyltransferase [Bifidobacterium pseudolongum]MDY3690188.1 N-acetylglutamate synthase [Bifidobacterium pseudolongum]RYQ65699.1 N-acetylglutamate synthase [Bifidobacterium pseudolongum subsp. globosum]